MAQAALAAGTVRGKQPVRPPLPERSTATSAATSTEQHTMPLDILDEIQ